MVAAAVMESVDTVAEDSWEESKYVFGYNWTWDYRELISMPPYHSLVYPKDLLGLILAQTLDSQSASQDQFP